MNLNTKPYPSSIKHFDMSDLAYQDNDDYKTIVSKNTKLRNLVIQASQKLNDITFQFQEKEKEFQCDKENILSELENISSNYKLYAEYYQNYNRLDEQYKKLQRDYNSDNKVIQSYEEIVV